MAKFVSNRRTNPIRCGVKLHNSITNTEVIHSANILYIIHLNLCSTDHKHLSTQQQRSLRRAREEAQRHTCEATQHRIYLAAAAYQRGEYNTYTKAAEALNISRTMLRH